MLRLLPFVLLLVLLAGCDSDDDAPVVATTTQVAVLARNVAGSRIQVAGILTPNADPHGYEPRARDVKRLVGAKLVLRSGGELDEWLDEARRSAGAHARVVTLGRDTDQEPHWWQDPEAAIAAIPRIRAALTRIDPAGRSAFDANAARYLGRLRALDRGIAACVATVPAAQRKLVTTHDTLGAYARRYGLQEIATVIPAPPTSARAAAGETAELVRTMPTEHAPAVFAESSVREEVARAIAD